MARGWIREVGRNFQLSLAGAPLGRLYDVRQALFEGYHDPYIEGWNDEAEYEEEEGEREEEGDGIDEDSEGEEEGVYEDEKGVYEDEERDVYGMRMRMFTTIEEKKQKRKKMMVHGMKFKCILIESTHLDILTNIRHSTFDSIRFDFF
jgi:hypothetical protein